MHACLNVDEIVRLITHELVASRREATVVALACCCKSFEDPALDVLWAKWDFLLPLLGVFPGDVWNDDECTSFKRLPTAVEWARFLKYSRRMRELDEFGSLDVMSLEVFSVVQPHIINNLILPNLNTLDFSGIEKQFIPFIPLFLSPGITSICLGFVSDCPKAMVASAVSSLSTLCPNLRMINLQSLPRDPMITVAVSGILLAINPNTLREFRANSPLTEEASEVVYTLPNLCQLSVYIERVTPLPSASLPNLTKLTIKCESEGGWPQLFHRATFGKLESVAFHPQSEEIGDFLEAFERVALSSSVEKTLSSFRLSTSRSWNPNYSSLLPFTQLTELVIESSCDNGCSSRVDDNVIVDLSRAMPKLRLLKLGDRPCRESTTGVTAKGLMALALHCPDLWYLRIHFQVASLSASPANTGLIRNTGPAVPWTNSSLTTLKVGGIAVPDESVLPVALTLLHIFPRINSIKAIKYDGEWRKVEGAIRLSRRIACCSRATLEMGS